MEFTDSGVILAARAYGENDAVVEIFTPARGRWTGLVYGGQGQRRRPLLQPGNEVRAEWKGRIDESLGYFTLELIRARAAAVMHDRLALSALASICALASACLPEREPHAPLYRATMVLLDAIEEPELWPALMARWELGLLAELGFGLTLDRCAATGARENLIYVSPRSASAVSAEAGAPYREKLLPLPPFLQGAVREASAEDVLAALRTTGHFIETRILHPAGRQLPETRATLLELLGRATRDETPL